MIGVGTLINVGGILLGGLAGMTCGKLLTSRFQETLITACGVCTLFIGLGGALEKSLVMEGTHFHLTGALMAAASMAIGSVIGELLNIHAGLEQFGIWLKNRSGNAKDQHFVNAFVTASLTVCIGAMAVIGAIEDGISGKYDILTLKAVLDGIIICIMTAAMGKGCIFSAIPVAVLQGSITVFAGTIGSDLTPGMLDNLSYVGSLLIFCIGINLVWNRQIRVSNMLPALLVAMIWAKFGW